MTTTSKTRISRDRKRTTAARRQRRAKLRGLQRLEDRLCLAITPGFYGIGMVTSTSEVYQLQVDFSADTLTPYQLGTLTRGMATALPARDDAVRAGVGGGEFLCIEDNQTPGSRGLPSILRETDISVFETGADLPVTDLGGLWMADPGGFGVDPDVRVNALEWSPAAPGQPPVLFAAGFAGIAAAPTFDTNLLFTINTATQEATPILDLTAIGVPAGDIAFDLTGGLYLSLEGGDILHVDLTTLEATPTTNVIDLPIGTPDFDALLPYEPGVSLVGIARDGSYHEVQLATATVTPGGSLRSGAGDVLGATEEVFGSTLSFELPLSVGPVSTAVSETGITPRLDQLWYEVTTGATGDLAIDLTDGLVTGRTFMLLYDSLSATIPVSQGHDHVEAPTTSGETFYLHIVDLEHGGTADLTFEVAATPAGLDFGDAPDPTYPTLLASNGARHTLGSGLTLGALVDGEADGQPDALATGDDLAVSDDEDGITFNTSLVPGQPVSITVNASATGFVDAWFDLDDDGTWSPTDEQFMASVPVSAGDNDFDFRLPGDTTQGTTYARFRISSTGGLLPTGLAADGEVEDYALTVETVNVFTATSTADSGAGSLREAITQANSTPNLAGGPDVILFDFAGSGPTLLQPLTAFPTITDPVVIDGETEPDYNDAPIIQIDNNASITDGLIVTGSGSVIAGLSFTGFTDAGLELNGGGGHHITGNYLGLDTAGNANGNYHGLRVQASAGNTIDDNVHSGNNRTGMFINGVAASGNLIINNLIGTDPTGMFARPNVTDGITNFAPATQIGLPGKGNLISGNARWGVVTKFADRTGVVFQGNEIGTDATGLAPLPNVIGVYMQNGPNIVGGSIPEGNVISGNSAYGVAIGFTTGNNNVIRGNAIGADETGTVAVPNTLFGVRITQGSDNIVGGIDTSHGNLISGNGTGVLVVFPQATGNQFVGNRIGTDITGNVGLGNSSNGVRLVQGTHDNLLTHNQISANGGRAVTTDGATTLNNDVLFNLIGTNAAGDGKLVNGAGGALRLRSPGSRVEGNVISSVDIGLLAFGNATDLEIVDNIFGTDESESSDLGMDTAIKIILGSEDNLIQGNVITNNDKGVAIVNGTGNTITDNSIYGNTTIGIDLRDDGSTSNDAGDADTGANNLQNSPVISQASLVGNQLTISYLVDSTTSSAAYPLAIEFFLSDGTGQGETLIGVSTYASADAQGAKTIVLDVTGLGVTIGAQILGTATDLLGNTGEFGQEFTVTS